MCKRLAEDMGVLVLPGSFFRQDKLKGEERTASGGNDEEGDEGVDRWIRFSVANVDDDKVKKVCERLKECEASFGWSLED